MTHYVITSVSGKLGCATYRTASNLWTTRKDEARRFQTRQEAELHLRCCNPKRLPEVVEVITGGPAP